MSAWRAAMLSGLLLTGGISAKVTVGLRYDDYSALSDTDLEVRILDACGKHGVACTFGVVPRVLGEKGSDSGMPMELPAHKRELLRNGTKAGYLEVALHGFTHASRHTGFKSEFSGVPREEQARMLRSGKALLDSIGGPVRTFIPPWNSYDRTTLEAMAEAGLSVLSADGQGPSRDLEGLSYVPATCLVPDLREAVLHGRRLAAEKPGRDPAVVAYFHSYEFRESGSARAKYSFREFEETLAWLAKQPDVETKTLAAIGEVRGAGFEDYQQYSRMRRLAPPSFERPLRPAFWAYPYAEAPNRWGAAMPFSMVAVFHASLALLAGCLAFLLAFFSRRTRSFDLRPIGCGFVLAGLALLFWSMSSVSFAGLASASILLGLGAPAFLTGTIRPR